MKQPKLTIVTRSSNRPKGFNRLRRSITGQTYPNIHHLVISDNKEDLDYIEEYGYDELLEVNRRKLISQHKSSRPHQPGCTKFSPHNLYFNPAQELITDGYVLWMDDDDYFANIYTIEEIMKTVEEDTLQIHKMVFRAGESQIPTIINEDNPPMLGKIGTPCITFHSKYLEYANWDAWKCGDFRVIDNLWNNIPNYKFIDKPFIIVPKPGMGNRIDI